LQSENDVFVPVPGRGGDSGFCLYDRRVYRGANDLSPAEQRQALRLLAAPTFLPIVQIECENDEAWRGTTTYLESGRPQQLGEPPKFVQTPAKPRVRKPIPKSVKMFVWQRDRGRCVECGSQERLEFDHIIPWADGGSDTARNLQLLCEPCNRRKGRTL
jgi:hypothetical protein